MKGDEQSHSSRTDNIAVVYLESTSLVNCLYVQVNTFQLSPFD